MKKYRSIWLFLIGVVCFSLFVCLSIESTEYAWEYNYNSNFLKNGYISIEYNDKNISAYLKYDKNLDKILYLIFDYPHKHYTFKHFEI